MNEQLKKFAAATNNELFDADYKDGEWMIEAVETHETLAQFAESSAAWAEKTPAHTGEIAGFKFISWHKVQVARGHARRQMSVIDLGDVRYALDCNLANY